MQDTHDGRRIIPATVRASSDRRWWVYGVAAVALVALAAPWFKIPRDQADSAGMLAHLHALFVGGDFLYDDEYARTGMSGLFAFVTDEGVVSNHWPMGASWLQAPGYVLGVTGNRLLAALGVGRGDALGIVPVLGVRAWAIVVLAGCAALVGRSFARAGGSAWAGVVGAACFVVGTPLLYYAFEAPLRPHLWGAAVVLGLTCLWGRPQIGTRAVRAVTLGVLAGLATCIRPQLAPLFLLAVHDAWPGTGALRRVLLAAGAFAIWPLLHARLQVWMYGDALMSIPGGVTHHVGHFLLSPYHGVLPWCPVLLLAAVALGRAAWLRERGAWLIVALVLHQVWLDSGMKDITPFSVLGTRTWSGGVSFGPRKLVDVLPLLLPAMLSWTAAAHRGGRQRMLGAVALAASVPTLLLHVAAFVQPDQTTGALHDLGSLIATTGLAFDMPALQAAVQQRALPWSVPIVVVACVTLPLLLAVGRTALALRRASGQHRMLLLSAALLVLGFVAHGWTSVLQVRSDALLAEDPQRMQRAAAELHSRHRAVVDRIEAHHATLRSVLGDGAAP